MEAENQYAIQVLFSFSVIFYNLRSKTSFLGSGTIANASGSKFGAGSRSPCPKLNFLKPFQPKFYDFLSFLQDWFLGPSAFSEFTIVFECGVYTGSHAHQRMRLEKLVWKNAVSARDLEYEIKIFQKTIFKSVRRPFSSWSDRRPFSIWKCRWPLSSWTDGSSKSVQMFLKPSWNFLKCP